MHFTTLTIAALASLSSVSAAPVSNANTSAPTMIPHDQVNTVVKILDSQGELNWTAVEGGKITLVPTIRGLEVLGNITTTKLRARDQSSTPDQWFDSHNWFGAAEIDGYDTEIACITTGDVMSTTIIKAGSSAACSALTANPIAATIDNGWYVFQQSGLADLTGANAYINWRMGNLGTAQTVSFTSTACTTAMNELFGSSCVADGQSQGASIEVASTLGWILGFDPNSD